MGPRPDGRGKHGAARHGPCRRVSRQWGRGQTAAERSRTRKLPRKRIRVNGAAARRPRKATHRPMTADRRRGRQWGRGQTAAESGCPSTAPGARPPTRQWGRGQTAAESLPADMVREIDGLRQWGRGQTAAESCNPLRHLGGVAGVNGAAARRPRKAYSAFHGHVAKARQWGRGQTAAESKGQVTVNLGTKQRQWGRGQTAAESCLDFDLASPAAAASMGPRPDGRGKGRRPDNADPCQQGVNGAAARRPRKVAIGAPRPPPLIASMGPRPDGRGKSAPAGDADGRALRQWGRGQTAAESKI